jgi:hypothetical protein
MADAGNEEDAGQATLLTVVAADDAIAFAGRLPAFVLQPSDLGTVGRLGRKPGRLGLETVGQPGGQSPEGHLPVTGLGAFLPR